MAGYSGVVNAPKTTVLLEHHLKALKLPTVLREYVPVAAACGQEKADYATYLLRLTERELLDRERRAADRRLQAARLPVIKTLDKAQCDDALFQLGQRAER